MTASFLAVTGPSPLWYLTRGTGLVALLLLTASLVLGIVNTSRWTPRGWPRFVTGGLHRNISLLVVVILIIHIVTAELDTFAPIGWASVVIPFVSPYRPIWLGLGTLAFDLLLALIVTSLLRERIGLRLWRGVHWFAYLSWPVALVHGLGTGTDSRIGWVQVLSMICIAAVVAAGAWRLAHGWQARPGLHVAAGFASLGVLLAVAVWALEGPTKPGWAKRAGTPSPLLASSHRVATPVTPTAPSSTPSPSTTPSLPPSATGSGAAVPGPPFTANLVGRLTQAGPDANGQVTITIQADLSGGMTGALGVVMRGQSSGPGVSLEHSAVSLGTLSSPEAYTGRVVALNGDQLAASVRSSSGSRLVLGINLQIDPSSGSVSGTLTARARTAGAPGEGTEDGSQ